MKLREMKINQSATITRVTAPMEMGRRIRDMGITPGTQIQVIRRAPLLDPVALKLSGFTLTLRNNEADHIEVEIS
ncbi:MAG: ferrous iron transport protein A [Gammaproteobacteria bacterium]|nr:MAG: ferrous iron transport protein A [Gammaproteobacteria bacterium]